MHIQLLLTGNELMAGDITDTNSGMIADFLTPHGWRLNRKVTLGDDPRALRQEIADMAAVSDVLLINGGLGPTVDDLTAAVLAELTGSPLVENPEAMRHLESWCAARGIQPNEANRKQASLPQCAQPIANATGSAVGIRLTWQDCLILATPGVPGELRDMMRDQIIPALLERFPSDNILTRRYAIFGIGESRLQQLLDEQWPQQPEGVEIGFRASMPTVELKLTARGDNAAAKLDTCDSRVRELLGDNLLGMAPTSLASSAIQALSGRGLTAATAESCTGGRVAAELVSVPGASEVFSRGWVSYANEAKRDLLGVDESTLQQFGAVSQQVAEQMATGALRASGADIALSVTGIAGPDGGTEEKPVGTVWLAWATREGLQSQRMQVMFGREMFQRWVTAVALDLIRRTALGLPTPPPYMTRGKRG